MSARVIPLTPQSEVDKAWTDYQRLVSAQLDDPSLMADRAHVEATVRAHSRFCELFAALDRRNNVISFQKARA